MIKFTLKIIVISMISISANSSEIELKQRIEILEAKIQKLSNLLEQHELYKPIILENNIQANKKLNDTNVKISMKPSPKFETEDGKYKFSLGGYLQTDYAHFTKDKANNSDGTYIRNARLSTNGVIDHDWFYTIENNFKGNRSKLTTALLSYNGFKNSSISFGQFNEKFGFENSGSGKTTTFIETAFLSVMAPSRRIGIGFNTYGSNWTGNIGLNANSQSYINDDNDRFKTISARATYNPKIGENNLSHLGISVISGKPKSSRASYIISAKPELDIAYDLINSGDTKYIKNINIAGVEAMFRHKSISLQSEYAINHITRRNFPRDKHKAAYVQLSWILTGEERNYDKINATFGGISPTNPFNLKNGSVGAWEIATRYNYIELNHNHLNKKTSNLKNVDFALNWYPNNYIRFMTNYIIVKSQNNQNFIKNNPNIILFRAQFGF